MKILFCNDHICGNKCWKGCIQHTLAYFCAECITFNCPEDCEMIPIIDFTCEGGKHGTT